MACTTIIPLQIRGWVDLDRWVGTSDPSFVDGENADTESGQGEIQDLEHVLFSLSDMRRCKQLRTDNSIYIWMTRGRTEFPIFHVSRDGGRKTPFAKQRQQ